jgi:transposase
MGLSIRVFIVEDDNTIKRLPMIRFERLLNRDPNEKLSKYAGKRVRYALIVVDLVNRRPIEIVKDEFAYLNFDDEGRLEFSEHEQAESLAFDMLNFFSLKQKDKRVIDARHKFAKKRYFDKYRWEPSNEIISTISEAIFGKFF